MTTLLAQMVFQAKVHFIEVKQQFPDDQKGKVQQLSITKLLRWQVKSARA